MKPFAVLFVLLLLGWVARADNRLQQANNLYADAKYTESIALYEALVHDGLESAALYYNLGNAYYRTQQYTKAVLHYERSLLLAPYNEACEANLRVAHNFVGDKMEVVPEFFLAVWFRMAYRALSPTAWAVLSMLAFVLVVAGLSLYLFSTQLGWRKSGFLVALAALAISVGALFLGQQHHAYVHKHPFAIVYTPALTVMSAPNDQGSELFVVHEGTKVRINQSKGDWYEIRLANGNVGWVKSTDILRI